jgi:hypothetical protein
VPEGDGSSLTPLEAAVLALDAMSTLPDGGYKADGSRCDCPLCAAKYLVRDEIEKLQ